MNNVPLKGSLLKYEPEELEEFTDMEELKTNYSILKTQRDTYKLLLANYEKIFLQDSYGKEMPKIINQIQHQKSCPLNGNNLNPIIETSTYSSMEMKIKASNVDIKPMNSNENIEEKTEKSKEKDDKNISEKIEQLNKEINALKTVFEEKNDLYQFSEPKLMMSEMNLKKFSSTSFQQNLDPAPKHKISIDKHLEIKNCEEYSNRNSEELVTKNNDELDKSQDSTLHMQNFFNNMTCKLKVLEERNENLTSQLQTGMKEKESLLKNIGNLQNELYTLNHALEEKTRENYKIQIETFLENQEKTQTKKANICKNLCTLI